MWQDENDSVFGAQSRWEENSDQSFTSTQFKTSFPSVSQSLPPEMKTSLRAPQPYFNCNLPPPAMRLNYNQTCATFHHTKYGYRRFSDTVQDFCNVSHSLGSGKTYEPPCFLEAGCSMQHYKELGPQYSVNQSQHHFRRFSEPYNANTVHKLGHGYANSVSRDYASQAFTFNSRNDHPGYFQKHQILKSPKQSQEHQNLNLRPHQDSYSITVCSSTQQSNSALCSLEEKQVWNETDSVIKSASTENQSGQSHEHLNLNRRQHFITSCSSTQQSNDALWNFENKQVCNEIDSVIESTTTENQAEQSHKHLTAWAPAFSAHDTSDFFYDTVSPSLSPVFHSENSSTTRNHALKGNRETTSLAISERGHPILPDNNLLTATDNEEVGVEHIEPSIGKLTSLQNLNFNQSQINYSLSNKPTHLSPKQKSYLDQESENITNTLKLPATFQESKTSTSSTTSLATIEKRQDKEKKDPSLPKTDNVNQSKCKRKSNKDKHPNQHNRLSSHRQIRSHVCQTDGCESKFCRADELRRHMRMHTGSKPYACETCKRRFSRKDHLLTHERTHTGDRRYQCSICSKRFTRGDELRRHEKIHTKEKKLKTRNNVS